MSYRADACVLRARDVGWIQACEEFYDPVPIKEYVRRMRDSGFKLREISIACIATYGYGMQASIRRWLDPEVNAKHYSANRKWKRKVGYSKRDYVIKQKDANDERKRIARLQRQADSIVASNSGQSDG